jgi:hypothetical protein
MFLPGKVGAGVTDVMARFVALCSKLPSLSILAGVALLVLIAACVLPCLIPLALLRPRQTRSPIGDREGDS